MNQTFKVFLASMLAAALCGFAQEFGGQEGGTETAPVAEVVDGGGAQILRQAQEAEEGEQNAAPVMFLENYLAEKGWNKGYDEEKNRIIVVGKVDFDVDDPEHITKDFIHLRSVKMNELLLRLKGQVIQLIFSTMSAQRILDIPGNPIQVVINEELKQAEESLASAAKALEKLNEEFATAEKSQHKLNLMEKLQFVAKWFEKTAAADFIASLSADKKASYDKAKEKLDKAKEVYEAALAKAEEVRRTLAEESQNEVSANSAMVIQGCTILKQAEGTVEEEGSIKFQVAAIYCWSQDMQEAAGEILQGHSIKFKPGKKTVQQWIMQKVKSGALATWVGPRNFIDSKGNMWFIGISCAPNHKNSSMARTYLTQASLKARSEVVFALFADSVAKEAMTETAKSFNYVDTKTGDVKTIQEIISSTSEHFGEKFERIQISGLAQLFSGTVTHPHSEQKIQVCVYGLDAGNVMNLKKIQTACNALAIQINTAQEFERGRQAQQRRAFEESKNNPAARAAGAQQANQEINAKIQENNLKRQPTQKNTGFRPAAAPATQNTQQKSTKLKRGVNFVDDDDDDL